MTKLILFIVLLQLSGYQVYTAKIRKSLDEDFDLMNLGYEGNLFTFGNYAKSLE